MPRSPEKFRTIYCDPGEDFGWAIGRDLRLLARGTTKMWDTYDYIADALSDPYDTTNPLNSPNHCRDGVDPEENTGPIGRIVMENFRIYPWKAHSGALDWDEVRTARVIGAITGLCRPRFADIPVIFQGANIKEAAVAAGAEELFDRPLRENRHQNDAIMHFTFFTNVELLGAPAVLSNQEK